MSILYSMAEVTSSDDWHSPLMVLLLNVDIYILIYLLKNLGFSLINESVACFSRIGALLPRYALLDNQRDERCGMIFWFDCSYDFR